MAAADYTSVVQSLYISYFGRPADYFGLQNFTAQLDGLKAPTTVAGLTAAYAGSASLRALIDGFGVSAESVALYGTDTVAFVNQIYINVLNRPSDVDGLKFWVNAINTGTLTKGNAALAIMNGALQNTSTQGVTDGKVVAAKVAVATAFTTALDTASEIIAYSGAAAAATARDMLKTVVETTTVTGFQSTINSTLISIEQGSVVTVPAALTKDTDTIKGTAANDVYNATGETLTPLDTIDGGTGTNTLNIIDAIGNQGSGLPALVKLANLQNVNVTTVGTVGNFAAAATTVAAETKTYTFGVPPAPTDTVAVSYNGGAPTTTAGLGASGTTAATAFANALNTAAGATIAVAAGVVVTVTAPVPGTPLSAIALSAATAAGDLPTVATTVPNSVTAAAVLAAVYDVSGITGLTNYVVSANGAVNTKVAGTTNVDLTTSKGAVSVSGGLTIKSAGATGSESFTGAALTSVTATGGTTVVASDLGNATLTTVTLSGNSGLATLTGDALTNVSLAKSSAAATILNATAKHTLNLGVNAVTGGAVITDAEATTVNLSVTGSKATTASTINLTTAKATTLNVTNAATLTLTATALANADQLTALTIKGAGTTTADMTGVASLASVDASASTGKNTLTIDNIASLSIKGGSGADKVAVTGALDAKGVVDLGAGNDTYTFTTAAVAGAKVSGGEGIDTLAVANGALINAAAASVYSGFETLSVSGGQGNYDMSILGLTAVTAGVQLAGVTNITSAAAGTTIGLTSAAGANLATVADLTFALKDATGTADSVTVSLTATESPSAAGFGNATADGSVTLTKFIAAAIEKVAIVSNVNAVDVDDPATVADESTVANQYVNTVGNLTAANATTVTFSGAAKTVVSSLNSDALVRIDATGATGDVTITAVHAADGASAAASSITYLGGAGVDTYTATTKGDLIAGNGGADVIALNAAGKDTLSYAKASDSILTLKDTSLVADGIADTATGFDVVTGFVSASDKIDLSALALASGAGRGALTLLTLSADTAAGLQTLIGTGVKFFNDGVANRDVAYATGGGNGYVFVDANGDGNYTAGTDLVIKLVGAPALVVTDISFG